MKAATFIRMGVLLAIAGAVVTVVFFSGGGPTLPPGSTLLVPVAGSYVEGPAAPLVARMLGESRQPFVGLLSTLATARRDERLGSVVLKIGSLGGGWGKAQEIRGAITRLREAGIETVAHLDLASFSVSREYYVATAADRITVTPGAMTPLVGLAAEYMFFGGLWEKLGVSVEFERIGRFKNAVDVYTGTEMSGAYREAATSILDSVNGQFIRGIAEGRGLSEDVVRAAIDTGPVTPDELVAQGLVDEVIHLDDLPQMAGRTVVEASDYAATDPGDVGFSPQAQFALIYGSGTVVSGKGRMSPRGEPVFASETVAEALEAAAEDPEIDAIILRIDSPGGSSLASEQVWDAMQRAKSGGKPIIASMSDVAASGGYYAAVGADSIVAPAGALTGSIGVFALRPSLGGVFEKVGINVESMTRGTHADFLLSTEPMSNGARERLRAMIEDTYALFIDRVATGRSMELEEVDRLGQGRVWTGEQAAERGLVDRIGGLHDAVIEGRLALGMAEDADVSLVTFPAPRGLAEEIQDLIRGEIARNVALAVPLPAWLHRIGDWVSLLPSGGPVLIPPFLVDIH